MRWSERGEGLRPFLTLGLIAIAIPAWICLGAFYLFWLYPIALLLSALVGAIVAAFSSEISLKSLAIGLLPGFLLIAIYNYYFASELDGYRSSLRSFTTLNLSILSASFALVRFKLRRMRA
jgi:hypothetical protein